MKSAIIILFISFLLFSANSCKQCSTCTLIHQPTINMCKANYASDEAYTQAFHQLEAQGYKCQ